MMDEEKRKEAQRKLTEEERVRRLSEGGETMRAQLAMEDAERSSQGVESKSSGDYLTPQEAQQRRMMRGTGEPYRGLGETQQAEQAMWKQGREEGMSPSGRNLTQDEMRRTGSHQVNYPAGGGSYYNETFEKPTGSAGPESSFGRNKRVPSGRQYAEGGMSDQDSRRMMTQDEMRRSGSDQTAYPAGSGSYYSETFEKPTGSAGPESSFGRNERIPSGRQYAESETMQGRMGAYPAPEPAPTGKMGQMAGSATGMVKERGGQASEMMKEKGGQAMVKGKEVGGTVISKTRDVTSQLTTKAKEFNESGRAEDIAHRAGESLGRAIRKTVSVAKEMASGFNRGVNPEKKKESREMAPEQGAEGDITLRTEQETIRREEVSQQTPRGQEKKYQEVRRVEKE